MLLTYYTLYPKEGSEIYKRYNFTSITAERATGIVRSEKNERHVISTGVIAGSTVGVIGVIVAFFIITPFMV